MKTVSYKDYDSFSLGMQQKKKLQPEKRGFKYREFY